MGAKSVAAVDAITRSDLPMAVVQENVKTNKEANK